MSALFPYQQSDLKSGGFIFEPSDYQKKDWQWLITKVEKKLNLWCNH